MLPETLAVIAFAFAIVAVVMAAHANLKNTKLAMKVSELQARVNQQADQLQKVVAEVQALKDSINNSDVELPEEAVAALDRLSSLLQQVDDINPDTTDHT